jgi:putative acetyltransferase
MTTEKIRPYSPDDIESVLDIWESASRVGHPFLSESFLTEGREKIRREYMPMATTWIFEEGGTSVGFISLIGEEVGALFVDPAVHRRGVGRALMDFAKRKRAALELGVFVSNTAGRAFYEECGFVTTSEYLDAETGHPILRMSYQSVGT